MNRVKILVGITAVLAVSALTATALIAAVGDITTVAGGSVGDGGLATGASLNTPSGVAVDASGNFFIGDSFNHRVRWVEAATGIVTTLAGNGTAGFSGDGGPATSAGLNFPRRVAVDASGNLFISDTNNGRIRRVDASTGFISTVAGDGTPGFSGDGGLATNTSLNAPWDVAVDASGNLYIADTQNHRIRRVDSATGFISTVAGNGTPGFSGDGGLATSASLINPSGVAVDASGNLFIADDLNHRIRRVDASTGTITTVAGTGTNTFSGAGGPATSAGLNFPRRVAVDASGNLFISDTSNGRIRRVDASTGIITTVAGTGTFTFSGDGGPATSASLKSPLSVVLDASGNLFIADTQNNRIRRVNTATGIIGTVAGGGVGDGGPATSASLAFPEGAAVDASGNLFIADRINHRFRKVDAATGIITTVAGDGISGFSGDGGLATSASLAFPEGAAVDGSGNLFIADISNQRIRRVDGATGIITTVAGDGTQGFSGDNGLAISASLNAPYGVAVDASGNLFIADAQNDRIRRVDASTGIMSTVAGDGTQGFSGDGGSATIASLNRPWGVALDASGNLFIADRLNHRIRRVDASTDVISTVAGDGNFGFSGDGGLATNARLTQPTDVAVDAPGNLFISDTNNVRIRRVDASTGIITTVAGTGTLGFSGDGGPATSAGLFFPRELAVDASGNLFIADIGNHRIRKVEGIVAVVPTPSPTPTPTPTPVPAAVPGLTTWGLGVLALLLGIVVWWQVARRRGAAQIMDSAR